MYLIKIDKNKKVKKVIVGNLEYLEKTVDDEAGQWVIREENVGLGFNYDSSNDIFYPPKPYDSWKLDDNFKWQPPIEKPIDKDVWNENKYSWQTMDEFKEYQLTIPFINAVDNLLNSEAKKRGYDSIISACSYSGYQNPFKSESESFIEWRGLVWEECYSILNDVTSGNRESPTIEELLNELPKFN